MLGFIAILGTALAAFAGAPVWASLIGAAVLAVISIGEQRKLAERFAKVGHLHVLHMAAWQSVGQALLAAGAAHAVGLISRIAWIAL